VTNLYRPLRSLREGCWFKLICGASFQHLPAVRSLTLAYALAGADCVDVAADPVVIGVAQDALRVAAGLLETHGKLGRQVEELPWLMVSLNDGEDPHFRKAEFDVSVCPANCTRPCETICPAQAIVFGRDHHSGVVDSLCYGCGRCLPICPIQNISTRAYVSTPAAIAPLVLTGVDAVEIHTQVGRLEDFKRLWRAIQPQVHQLKLIAISCPDGEGLIDYLWSLYDLVSPLPCPLIWQTDGRPMSGDIGDGATRAAIRLGQKVLAAGLPGYVQLAGGTNRHTVPKLKALNLTKPAQLRHLAPDPAQYVAGVAYGSYARSLLASTLAALEPSPAAQSTDRATALNASMLRLEQVPDLLWQAVEQARLLVAQIKSSESRLSFEDFLSEARN
jgi:Fe-S-cluster-containing hydrogenase component 2